VGLINVAGLRNPRDAQKAEQPMHLDSGGTKIQAVVLETAKSAQGARAHDQYFAVGEDNKSIIVEMSAREGDTRKRTCFSQNDGLR